MRALGLYALLILGACDETIDGQHPVGGSTATEAAVERFVRRLHLDLTGSPPDDATLATARDRVVAAAGSTAIRRTLAEELVATPAFGTTFVAELENRVFGGETLSRHYDFVCGLARNQPHTKS